MSKGNDLHFDVIMSRCKVCKNFEEGFKCKIYGDRPKENGYTLKYDCTKRDVDKNNVNYNDIKEIN